MKEKADSFYYNVKDSLSWYFNSYNIQSFSEFQFSIDEKLFLKDTKMNLERLKFELNKILNL